MVLGHCDQNVPQHTSLYHLSKRLALCDVLNDNGASKSSRAMMVRTIECQVARRRCRADRETLAWGPPRRSWIQIRYFD
jgi:hypothetical protein